MQYEWDEAKRESNLRKHGYDFADADIVYENPDKVTLPMARRGESRLQDIALVKVQGKILSLVYVVRGYNIRVISFEKPHERSVAPMTISGHKSLTDWDRVNRDYDSDAPIPYDPNDPDDGPYDPNDDAAVEAYWKQATIWQGWPNQVLIQKDGVPVHPDGTPRIEHPETKAAETGSSKTISKAS